MMARVYDFPPKIDKTIHDAANSIRNKRKIL